jgi:hypothetical protein
MKQKILRAVVEITFIIFLFYSNLLMGEYTKNGMGNGRGLIRSLQNIFTASNFLIAIISAFIGYAVFEFLRKKY